MRQIEKIGGFVKETAKNGKEFTEIEAGSLRAGDELIWVKIKRGSRITYRIEGLGKEYSTDDGEMMQRAYIKKVKLVKADGTVKEY